MSKIVRLTEADLMRLVKRVIKEQSEMGKDPFKKEGGSDPVRREGGRDFDHFGKIVLPQMKAAGFRLIDESKSYSLPFCKYYNGNCCKYFVYPKHSNGVNLGLQCEDDGWKYIVYTHPGSKNLREFKWSKGTDAEVKNAAQQAVDYAIQLKNKMYPKQSPMQEQTSNEVSPNRRRYFDDLARQISSKIVGKKYFFGDIGVLKNNSLIVQKYRDRNHAINLSNYPVKEFDLYFDVRRTEEDLFKGEKYGDRPWTGTLSINGKFVDGKLSSNPEVTLYLKENGETFFDRAMKPKKPWTWDMIGGAELWSKAANPPS